MPPSATARPQPGSPQRPSPAPRRLSAGPPRAPLSSEPSPGSPPARITASPPVPSLPGRYFWPGSARPGPPPPPAGPAPFPPRWRSAEAAGEEVTGEGGGGAVYGVCLWDWGARPAPIPLPVLRDPPAPVPITPPGGGSAGRAPPAPPPRWCLRDPPFLHPGPCRRLSAVAALLSFINSM